MTRPRLIPPAAALLCLGALVSTAAAAPPSTCQQHYMTFAETVPPALAARATAIKALAAEIPRDGLDAVRARLEMTAGPASEPVARAWTLARVAWRVSGAGVESSAAAVYEMAAAALDGHCRPGDVLPWTLWDAAADSWRSAWQGREAVAIYTRLLTTPGGPAASSRPAIMALSARGDARRTFKDFEAALADQREALALAEKALPADDPDRAWMHQRMALLFDEWPGRDAEAEAPYREVLRIREAEKPPHAAQLGRARLNLAGYLADLGRLEEALTLAQAADRDWAVLGQSLSRVKPLDIVIRAGARLSRLEDVWQAADKAAAIVEGVRGQVTAHSVHYRLRAAGAAVRLDRYADAERHFDAVMATRGALEGAPDAYTIVESLRLEAATRKRGLRLEDIELATPGWLRAHPARWVREAGGALELTLLVDPRPGARLMAAASAMKAQAARFERSAGTFRGAKTVEWQIVWPGEGEVHARAVGLTARDAVVVLFIRGTTPARVAAARAEIEAGLSLQPIFGAAPLAPKGDGAPADTP